MKSFLHEVKNTHTTGWPEADLLQAQFLSNNHHTIKEAKILKMYTENSLIFK